MQKSSILQNTDDKLERINRLFLRFSAIYGHIWTSQFREANYLSLAKKEWDETLKEINNESLKNALKECRKNYEMPPTLPQFYQLCRRFQPKENSNGFKYATEKPCSPEVAKEYLEKIKFILANRS